MEQQEHFLHRWRGLTRDSVEDGKDNCHSSATTLFEEEVVESGELKESTMTCSSTGKAIRNTTVGTYGVTPGFS